MPAVPDWNKQFTLTNPYNGTMEFNVQTDTGLYLFDRSGCHFDITVRSTKNDVPQGDGSILHHRFLTGSEIGLQILLMQDTEIFACDDLLATMLDNLSGAFRSLLNAGDNEGRLSWEVSGNNERMLDDIRLLSYPSFDASSIFPSISVVVDSKYPYAEDEGDTRTPIPAGDTVTITNNGTADLLPVFQVNRLYPAAANGTSVSSFLLENITTGQQFSYYEFLPGGTPIAANRYAEIDCFDNTIYESTTPTGPGNGRNLKAGVDELNSEYFVLPAGVACDLTCDIDTTVIWQAAWG